MKQNDLSSFGRGSPKEHFCEITVKTGPLVKEEMSFKGFSIFSCGGYFVQRSERFKQFW